VSEGKLTAPVLTAFYASALAVVFVWLSVRVAYMRWRTTTHLGGGGKQLWRLVRVHANFDENVPLALPLPAFAEILGAAPEVIHGCGATLLAASLLRVYGVGREPHWR
jgi:uncharacterized protein